MLACLFAMPSRGFSQCAVPTGLNVTNVSVTTAKLSWTAVAGASSYTIEVQNASGNNTVYFFTTTVATAFYNLSGLTNNANYKFKVRTNCGGDHSNWSPYFFFTKGTSGSSNACALTPGGLSVTNVTASGAKLNWTTTGAAGYRVVVEDASGNNVNYFFTATTANTFLNIAGLNSGSNYKFKVRSLCGGNTGPWSVWKNFTTASMRLEESVASSDFTLYPNPATNAITVNLSEELATNDATLSLYDVTGREMFVQTVGNNATQDVNIANFPSGLYFVVVTTGDHKVSKKLSVVR